ncbi:MAG: choice-of-anchor X domain-containing protein [Candidatus Krumholzibacteriia bacterium]
MRPMIPRALIATALLALIAFPAWSQTPQTIVIDGVNDFLPGNLLDADGGDTQFPNIDIGNVYVTNDAVNLFIGFEHELGGWGQVQLGVAIDVFTAAGGTADPWGRAIEWSTAAYKPDFMFYVNLDNNWQAAYRWTGTEWAGVGTAGIGALGWTTSTGFDELAVLLSTLGVSAGSPLNIEAWVTQDADTKGPLDAVAGDASQLSTVDFTLWDTPSPIPLSEYLAYTVLAAADQDPPRVTEVQPTSFPVGTLFDIHFNEPVDATTAQVPGNYVVSGGTSGGVTVTGAVRDAGSPNIVHLTLSAPLTESASLWQLTVAGVKDVAGNTIVAGSGDRACFMLKHVLFRGRFGPYLQNSSSPPDQFSVEGNIAPLTFDPLCDSGMMVDTGTDDIWEYGTVFLVNGDCGAGTAERTLQWKLAHNCTTWEPLASNREHLLTLANGASDVLDVWWNDEDPSAFTQHDIDVDFFVDMNLTSWTPGGVVAINGDTSPLSFVVPSANLLVDDGTGVDAVAGDGIHSTRLRFPAGSKKNVAYKFLLDGEYECSGQSDRSVFLNDEAYDVAGGLLGPLTLPVVKYDFCNTIWRPVEVIFRVAMNVNYDPLQPGDVLAVNGTPNHAVPPTFDWSVPSLNTLADDGVYPDATAGDGIYSVSVVFPDTSQQNIEYKYLLNDVYECLSSANRSESIDPDNHDAAGNPQVLAVDLFDICTITAIDRVPRAGVALRQNVPNPFNPRTEIRFVVPRGGRGSLRIYDVRGELVRTLQAGEMATGEHVAVWDGCDDGGVMAGSGVYLCRLEVNGETDARSMVLLK